MQRPTRGVIDVTHAVPFADKEHKRQRCVRVLPPVVAGKGRRRNASIGAQQSDPVIVAILQHGPAWKPEESLLVRSPQHVVTAS